MSILEPADIWCADIMDWKRLFNHEGFKILNMLQDVISANGYSYKTTRCPIRIDGEILNSSKGSPQLGEHNNQINSEFYL